MTWDRETDAIQKRWITSWAQSQNLPIPRMPAVKRELGARRSRTENRDAHARFCYRFRSRRILALRLGHRLSLGGASHNAEELPDWKKGDAGLFLTSGRRPR